MTTIEIQRRTGQSLRAHPRTARRDDVLLRDVLAAARRLVELQRRADTSAAAASQPASLADAIDRDFLLFDLHDAARELTAAVAAADQAEAARTLPHA
jgi:hypothetical protein